MTDHAGLVGGITSLAMIRRLFRVAVKFAMVGGAAAGVAKVLGRRRDAGSGPVGTATPWPPIPEPAGTPTTTATPASEAEGDGTQPAAEPVAESNGSRVWAEPEDDGTCPASHPVKAKLGSGVFHLPGMANYDRTKPDRCYPDETAAEADGLRQAKR